MADIETIFPFYYAAQYNGSNREDLLATVPPNVLQQVDVQFESEENGVLTLSCNQGNPWRDQMVINTGDWVMWTNDGGFSPLEAAAMQNRFWKLSDIEVPPS